MLSTDYVPGVPNWLDIGSPDVDRAVAYYTALFGWGFEPLGEDTGYGVFRQDEDVVAAIGPLTEEGARSEWTVYFRVDDADGAVAAAAEAGGAVRVPPFDVFTNGRMAALTDPTGAEFAIWQPRDTAGLDLVTDPVSLAWVELHTDNPGDARAFYHSVLEWNSADVPTPGGDGEYVLLTPRDGGDSSSFGGVVRKEHGKSHWLPYFEVPDADAVMARNDELGGGLVLPAVYAAGVGRTAWLSDPSGARFGVLTSTNQNRSDPGATG
ncbi:VOC family protein [Actinosynnema sp. NPDC020468]|uniref:VOC family protein n=1 Tax=Actinosynnema sp. NPDC020468 TaxID=3154488 RepID=UPI0034098C08